MDEFLPIKSFRVKNFKGIRDSGEVRFTPLTVFIGNNGSGKSSLIEALQTYQDIVVNGLDEAMNRWRGFENIHNPPISLTGGNGSNHKNETIDFNIVGEYGGDFRSRYLIKSIIELTSNELRIAKEVFDFGDGTPYMYRDFDGNLQSYGEILGKSHTKAYSIFHDSFVDGFISNNKNPVATLRFLEAGNRIKNWQFATLNPANMTQPRPLKRTGGNITLNPDGSNIAEYLNDIRKQDQDGYENIIEALTYVLPYLKDMQPNITTQLELMVSLQMYEHTFANPIQQWLLSTGTMRILCLLALFRHPTPPPVIFIEEIENGLDPRTIQFIVEEIRNLIVLGKSQVVITTHSPYLLDLLDLSQIVVVERENGETTFSRPADNESLRAWAKKFSPGQLYTMNQLTHLEG